MTQRTDIEPLTQLRDKLVPGRRRPPGTGRRDDLEKHFAKLRTEFAGEPELCFELARTIVLIRREINLARNLLRFFEILEFDPEFLCEALSTRWLVSVCDTIADHGDAQQRNAALCISLLVNLVKLAESEQLMRSSSHASPERYMEQWPHDLTSGVTSYHVLRGDMPQSLFRRVNECLGDTPFLQLVWATILERMKHSDNLLTRLASLNPIFWDLDSTNTGR